jgi:enoyl-CoA hydratase/carnithine racemase
VDYEAITYDYETIIYEKKDGVCVITLNRPEKKNSISRQLSSELIQAIDEAEKDGEIKVVVLTGGRECFCAGADLSEVGAPQPQPGRPRPPEPVTIDRIRDFPKPTIAAISGPCVAGGLELALACDIRVASETARIGDGHIKMGLIGGGGSPTRISRLVGQSRAKELILTGVLVDGTEAWKIGLVNHVYPKDAFMDETMAMAGKMAAFSPLALQLSKKAIDAAGDMDEYQSLRFTRVVLTELLASDEFRSRVAAFLKKNK